MLLDGAALPIVLEIDFGRNPRLSSQVRDHDSRHFILVGREARLFLKEFEQDRKSQSGRPRFIAKQGQFFYV